jgi:tRNA-dihydrouridine synthase
MLSIGNVEIAHPFVQAALSGYSDLPMRRIARAHGASYTINEVVLDKSVLHESDWQRQLLTVHEDDHPVAAQLMGADPTHFGRAARALADAGYDVIDINFGCPAPKVLDRCRAGYLLGEPAIALEMVRRVIDAVGRDKPVTVKMRRGLDDSAESERNFFRILDGALEMGVSAVTVHGRTVEQKYKGRSQWPFLRRLARHVAGDSGWLRSARGSDVAAGARARRGSPTAPVGPLTAVVRPPHRCSADPSASATGWVTPDDVAQPPPAVQCGRAARGCASRPLVFGSGDLFTAADCIAMMAQTGVDGVTIARGAIGYPWIFRECLALAGGEPLPEPPTLSEQRETIERHLGEALRVYDEHVAAKMLCKFGIRYSKQHPKAKRVREAFNEAKGLPGFKRVLDKWYASCAAARTVQHASLIWPSSRVPS